MKTLEELTLISEEEKIKQIDFFNLLHKNKIGLSMLKDEDIKILVNCLAVFQKTGINYFNRYISFIQNTYQPLEKGMDTFVAHQEELHLMSTDYNCFKNAVEQRISDMSFFGINQVNGLSIEDYQTLLRNDEEEPNISIEIEETELVEEEIQMNEEEIQMNEEEIRVNEEEIRVNEEEIRMKKIVDNYFNFEKFNLDNFETEFKRCLKQITGIKYNEQDLQTTNFPYSPGQTYLVVLFLTNTPIKIGKTTNLLNWVSSNLKDNPRITFGFCPVKPELTDELLTKFCIYFDTIQRNENTVLPSNKLYTNSTQAEVVYQYLYKVTPRKLKKIVNKNGINQHNFGPTIIFEKKELDILIKKVLKLDSED